MNSIPNISISVYIVSRKKTYAYFVRGLLKKNPSVKTNENLPIMGGCTFSHKIGQTDEEALMYGVMRAVCYLRNEQSVTITLRYRDIYDMCVNLEPSDNKVSQQMIKIIKDLQNKGMSIEFKYDDFGHTPCHDLLTICDGSRPADNL